MSWLEFSTTIAGAGADPGLTADLTKLLPETTDDVDA